MLLWSRKPHRSAEILYFCSDMAKIHYEVKWDRCPATVDLQSIALYGVPAAARLIYDGPRNKVYVLPLKDSNHAVNIKAFCVPNVFNRLIYGNFRPGKARRAYNNGHRLLSMGIMTPCPLAYIEERKGPIFGHSYFISEQLPDEWHNLRGAHDWPDLDEVASALAGFMVDLHNKGVWMKDFSPGNVMMRRSGGKIEFALVDINRMEFGVRKRHKLMSNFRSIFDTSDLRPVILLARKYAEVLGLTPGTDGYKSIENEALAAVETQRCHNGRKKRLKRLLGIRRH